mmetsp:Transcript_15254/g.42696  ORF Transcript_15254/g.42696 Transcript_15254/m.42696 type:complete len:365 (+) Transcript_15254:128-1222(+)
MFHPQGSYPWVVGLQGTLSLTVTSELDRRWRLGAQRRSLANSGGPAYRVVEVPNVGRGMVAAKYIPQGCTVLTCEPILSFPETPMLRKVCYFCLARLKDNSQVDRAGRLFCSQHCAESAWRTFLQAETAADTAHFSAHCLETDDAMSLMAARHVFSRLQNPHANPVQELGYLCRTDTGNYPAGKPKARWVRSFELLEESIVAAQTSRQNLPWRRNRGSKIRDWYFDAIKAIACNCFQVSYGANIMGVGVYINPAAVLSNKSGDILCNKIGTACFRTGSLINHSCAPNVTFCFPCKDGTVRFVAKQDIPEGEPLSISYIHPSQPLSDRQATLKRVYGFECTCQRCAEEWAFPSLGIHLDPDPAYC